VKRFLSYRLGAWNTAGISLCGGIIGCLSVLFLGSKAQGEEIKQHAVKFFFTHVGVLMLPAGLFAAVLVLLNIIVDFIVHRRLNAEKLAALLLRSLIISLIVAVLGTCFLLAIL
jgi:hypothetical protein